MYHLMKMEVGNESGTPVVRFTIAGQSSLLGVRDLDTFIAQLTHIRAAMLPAHPLDPPGSDYPLEVDPCWRVDRSPLFEGVVLSLRHVGIGWTAFALPPPNLSRLLDALTARLPAVSANRATLLN